LWYFNIYFLFSDKPACAEEQTMVIGVALREIASVNCTVNANPVERLKFLWTFNSSSELNYLPDSRFTQDGTTSQVNKSTIPTENTIRVLNAAIKIFYCSHIWSLWIQAYVIRILAIIRIMPFPFFLQQKLTLSIIVVCKKNMKQS
jgi:hypothetical protein